MRMQRKSHLNCYSNFNVHFLDIKWSHEKIKTMLMQNFGGQTKSIMEFLKVAYATSLF